MNVTKEIVTPKKAMEWLKLNVKNRPSSSRWVDELTEVILAGEFKLNGDCIRFNGSGNLIDGQHRLQAVIKSGKSIETYVVRGLEHAAFDTIDQGKKRSTSDILAREGEKHYTTLAAAARAVWQIQNGYDIAHKQVFRPSMMHKVIAECSGIRDVVQDTIGMQQGRKCIINPGIACGLVYLTKQSCPKTAETFWPRVFIGENLTKSMPEFWLRQRLTENLTKVAKLPRHVVVALAIKAWNAAKSGQQCKNLKWNSSSEEFPTIK